MDNMNDLVTNCVLRQKIEIKRILEAAFVQRDLTPRLVKALDDEAIKVIIGPRRSGKSSLAIQALQGKKFAYFNFEDESINFEFSAESLLASFNEVYAGFEYILFDEIQLFPNWEHLVNRLHRLGYKILITGSNSKLLSGELASSLTGRYIEFQLLTFSYSEYLDAKNLTKNQSSFADYLESGGYPSVVTGRSHADDFLPTLWDAIVLKDLVQRYKIRRTVELKNLLYLVLTSMASRATARSLSRGINESLTHSTVNKYLSWAEGAYLCSMLHSFSFKARERVNSDKKLYLYDTGFFTAHKKSSNKDIGRLLENYIFIELCRSGLVPNLDFFCYQTKARHEVDFYVPQFAGGAMLIQACYSTTNADTLKREIRALTAAGSELGVKDLVILTCDDTEQRYEHDGFQVRSLPTWQTPSPWHANPTSTK